jgi:type III restriction enzyme
MPIGTDRREANGTREYNADMIVIENDGTHWVVEIKADRDAGNEEVRGKRLAAQRWTARVSADERVGVQWRYLLVYETDIDQAQGSWSALKRLGS